MGSKDLKDTRAEQVAAAIQPLYNLAHLQAQSHVIQPGKGGSYLYKKLLDNRRTLRRAYTRLQMTEAAGRQGAAEMWWLDHFYVIEEHLRVAISWAYRKADGHLVCITGANHRPVPRVYEIADNIVAYAGGNISMDAVTAYVQAYQQITVLHIRELDEMQAVMRMVLLERITGITNNMLSAGDIGITETQRLTDKGALKKYIDGLRILCNSDWQKFVSAVCAVEQAFRSEPAGIYPQMDALTCNSYRKEVSNIAARSLLPETLVAAHALALTEAAGVQLPDAAKHVGFYLLGNGRSLLEAKTGMRHTPAEKVLKLLRQHATVCYLSAITVLVIAGTVLTQKYLVAGWDNGWLSWMVLALAALCISQVSVSAVNYCLSCLLQPQRLPRLDLKNGIPAASRTLVVVPAMLTGRNTILSLANDLEVYYLGNKDPQLFYCLLYDFCDAAQAEVPEDASLLEYALSCINRLNEQYAAPGQPVFYLLCRKREWNAAEKKWMGHERKRGKLEDLNALLRGQRLHRFLPVSGDISPLQQAKYVITLDADTQLLPASARKLVGVMAHPLNHPVLDAKRKCVTSGYGMLQPRISLSIPVAEYSPYIYMYGSEPGIDTYTCTVSDVYQDLFGEGSFIGKGIYDIDVAVSVLQDRFPDNLILSHDLLEGCYVRSGLVSDIVLREEFPVDYTSDMKRRHRWIRGDWQIAGWLLPLVPGLNRLQKNPLSILSKWKIFDNLRRSIVPIAALLLLGLAFLNAATVPGWMLFVALVFMCQALVPAVIMMVSRISGCFTFAYWQSLWSMLRKTMPAGAYHLVCLPYEAARFADAILKAGLRMVITKRRLLEWNVTDSAGAYTAVSLYAMLRQMYIAPVIALGIGVGMWFAQRQPELVIAALYAGAWALSPVVAWRLSQRRKGNVDAVTPEDRLYLRKAARKTWGYFEHFTGKNNSWLTPDHFQEAPVANLSPRISPTNMGLMLLSNLSACDLGYLTTGAFLHRTRQSMHTLGKLEKCRGHFFNWYDTHSLKAVKPHYVSTVDSGNLLCYLLTLQEGINALLQQPAIAWEQLVQGFEDTLAQLQGTGEDHHPALTAFKRQLPQLVHAAYKGPVILRLCELAGVLVRELPPDADERTAYWLAALLKQAGDLREEMLQLQPWLFSAPSFLPRESLRRLASFTLEDISLLPSNTGWLVNAGNTEVQAWLQLVKPDMERAADNAAARITLINTLAAQCAAMADMDYSFLYDEQRRLLVIGYNADTGVADSGYYDLLASEARMAVFAGVAQGKLPEDSWFATGRPLVHDTGGYRLLSWQGSMFEYMMPSLVMPLYEDSLLDHACKAALTAQKEYGQKHHIPWGISESAFYEMDIHLHYHYAPFGVPQLGIRYNRRDELVVAPYASFLAMQLAPAAACNNLRRLSAAGAEGKYGFYDAVDYMPERRQGTQSHEIVKTFMAHHQGMSLLAVSNVLHSNIMQRRFAAVPVFKTSLHLLEERLNAAAAYTPQRNNLKAPAAIAGPALPVVKETITSPHTPLPEIQLLSNGSYHLMITAAGAGYSRRKQTEITRWRNDCTLDNYGTYCYIKDVEAPHYWSATYQPTRSNAEEYSVAFSLSDASFSRKDHGIHTTTRVMVLPDEDAEIRRTTLHNPGGAARTLEITSYTEIVLSKEGEDLSHPAFNNLFVSTEVLQAHNAILCQRRPRSTQLPGPCFFHAMYVQHGGVQQVSYETDRLKFIGRARSTANPQAVAFAAPLSNSSGMVLDPIAAIKYRIKLAPGETAVIDMLQGVARSKAACTALLQKYRPCEQRERLMNLGDLYGAVVLKNSGAAAEEIPLFRRLASAVLFSHAPLRGIKNAGEQQHMQHSVLWKYNVSGNLPLILCRISSAAQAHLAAQLFSAHYYWRMKGLPVNMMIVNECCGDQFHILQEQLLQLLAAHDSPERSGGIYITGAVTNTDMAQMQTAACMVIDGAKDSLADYFPLQHAFTAPPEIRLPETDAPAGLAHSSFDDSGKEFIIHTGINRRTPQPWVNILANPLFGTVVTESGPAYSWYQNAYKCRLTLWNDDTVSDLSAEAFFLRDEDDGTYWSPMPGPFTSAQPYVTRHGYGYTVFEQEEHGIQSEVTMYADIEAPVRYTVIKLTNCSGRPRRITVTGYVEWVLGQTKLQAGRFIETDFDDSCNAIYAVNPSLLDLPGCTAFFCTSGQLAAYTADRTSFVGRNGTLRTPAAMHAATLSGVSGINLDACAALQCLHELAPGEKQSLSFLLGAGKSREEAAATIAACSGPAAAQYAKERITQYWDRTLSAVQVRTPDHTVNTLINGWLQYQNITGGLTAHTAYEHAKGDISFRELLQHIMGVVHTNPVLAKEQLLMAAGKQFSAGGVLHFWHPPGSEGLSTQSADDFLWLPLVTCYYTTITGDLGILDEQVRFLSGSVLQDEEAACYDVFKPSSEVASLYLHCVKAVQHGLRRGRHGLRLIGAGDWGDNLNKAGAGGQGESVWASFLLGWVLKDFATLSRKYKDPAFADYCLEQRKELEQQVMQHSWGNEWFFRALTGTGLPIGAADGIRNRIDNITQSWSVLSSLVSREYAQTALEAAYEKLVDDKRGLVHSVYPAYDIQETHTGDICSLQPGMGENGGQDTVAAIWMAMAFAKLEDGESAWKLLEMINPVLKNHTPEQRLTYRGAPYLVSAHLYTAGPYAGSAAWSWCGAGAAWLYRLVLEYLLGLKREGDRLSFRPCIPGSWDQFSLDYRYGATTYHITVCNTRAGYEDADILLNGVPIHGSNILLTDDAGEHQVTVNTCFHKQQQVLQ